MWNGVCGEGVGCVCWGGGAAINTPQGNRAMTEISVTAAAIPGPSDSSRCVLSFLSNLVQARMYSFAVLFSSVQGGMYARGKAHMRSTLSVRIFPNVAFETVPVLV